MCACYVVSQFLVIASTGFTSWWSQISSGFRRLIGNTQISGFNSPTVHVSLISRLAADASHYGVTYLILGLGSAVGAMQVIAALRQRGATSPSTPVTDRARLLVAVWSVASAAYLAYATSFGTLEEQMYYLAFIPSVCALVLGARRAGAHLGRQWRPIAFALLAMVVMADSAVWVTVHRTPDDEYRQLLAWAPKHLAPGSTVAVTDSTAQFVLSGVVLGQWGTIPLLIKNHADYVLLSTTLDDQGYGLGSRRFDSFLAHHATIVFRADGPSEGRLELYNVRAITGATGMRRSK
jgi:hypothetical protein